MCTLDMRWDMHPGTSKHPASKWDPSKKSYFTVPNHLK